MKGFCDMCENEVREPGRDMHEQCEMAKDILDDLTEMLMGGPVEPWVTDFVPELNFVFEEDWRLQRTFKTAEKVIVKSALYFGGGDFPLAELDVDFPTSEVNRIFDVLGRAGLAWLEGDTVRLAPLGKKLCGEQLATGAPLDSAGVRGPIEELRGWICITVAKTLLDGWLRGNRRAGRPRNLLEMLQWLSNVVIDNPDKIPATLEANEIFYEQRDVFDISKAQIERLATALLGIRGKSAKVFAAFRPSGGGSVYVDLKPQTQIFLERERERLRERRRARGR